MSNSTVENLQLKAFSKQIFPRNQSIYSLGMNPTEIVLPAFCHNGFSCSCDKSLHLHKPKAFIAFVRKSHSARLWWPLGGVHWGAAEGSSWAGRRFLHPISSEMRESWVMFAGCPAGCSSSHTDAPADPGIASRPGRELRKVLEHHNSHRRPRLWFRTCILKSSSRTVRHELKIIINK